MLAAEPAATSGGNPAKTNPRSDIAHATAASYLTNPAALNENTTNPSGDAVYSGADLRQLALFRGFITKVRHNGLRRAIPCTLRLLAAMELEIEFFAAISADYVELRAAGPLQPDEHLVWLGERLAAWLHTRQHPAGDAILDMFGHETVAAALRSLEPQTIVAGRRTAPTMVGELWLRQYRTDVIVAGGALITGRYDRSEHWIERRTAVAYHRPPGTDQIVVSEIDQLTAVILSKIDGQTTVQEIADSMAAKGLPQIDTELVAHVLEDTRAQGFVEHT